LLSRTLLPVLLLVVRTALAQSGELTVSDAWIRATPGSEVAAAYLTLHNGGSQTVVITGVHSTRLAMAMIHETRLVGTQSTMRPQPQLSIAPGATLRLAPGGLHIMLHPNPPALTPGESVPLVLELAGGGTLRVTARVRALGEG
jgi:periplasmic copper chaperone A